MKDYGFCPGKCTRAAIWFKSHTPNHPKWMSRQTDHCAFYFTFAWMTVSGNLGFPGQLDKSASIPGPVGPGGSR